MDRLTVGMVGMAVLLLTGCTGENPSPRPTVEQTRSASPTPGLVVTIGDSIMRGNGLSTDQAWPALLAADRGWTIQNLGCDSAGFLAEGNPSECDGTYDAIIAAAIALKPDTVFIQGSSNDFGQDDDGLAEATTQQITELRDALPGARIIGLSTIWSEGTPPDQLETVNAQVESAVEAVGGTYLDIGQPLGGHAEWLQSDDVHPTADGQVAISEAVENALDRSGLTLS